MNEATIVAGLILFVIGFIIGKTQKIVINNVERLRVETSNIVIENEDGEKKVIESPFSSETTEQINKSLRLGDKLKATVDKMRNRWKKE